MPSTGTIPLQQVIPGQLIASALWNNEFGNVNTLMTPSGLDTYSGTDAQMQLQTNPFPGSVTSHATSTGGELERIRYQLAQAFGTTYWYQLPALGTTLANAVLSGEVRAFAGSSTPTGWLACDGSAVSRTTYATLFTAIGTAWGTGDGSTTFNVPDLRGKCLIGSGAGSGLTARAIADSGGEEQHVLTTNELALHGHNATTAITDPGHTHLTLIYFNNGNKSPSATGSVGNDLEGTDARTTGITATTTVQNAGLNFGHNNMQPYACVAYLIKT